MFDRPGSLRRPTAFGDQPRGEAADAGPRKSVDGLTRAQSKALSRCAPLTPAEFKARRRAAEQGLVSLREVLDADAGGRTGSDAGGA